MIKPATAANQTIAALAAKSYSNVDSKTLAYIYAANDALGVEYFSHTVFNSDGRLFCGGEIDEGVYRFVDLEDPDQTVYTLAEFQALDTDQNWYVL